MVVCKNKEDCLSIWDVLAQWQHISLNEFEELINSRVLQAYIVLHPHDWTPDVHTLTLRAVEGRLTIEGNGYVDIVRDEAGRMIDASADGCLQDENGEPICETEDKPA